MLEFECQDVPGHDPVDAMNEGLLVALHGRHVSHPWLAEPTEDLYSLAFKQAAAYGWSFPLDSGHSPPEGQRWAQYEAGGADPTTSAQADELAWIQAGVHSLPGQSLPIVPVAAVLLRALDRLGTTVPTGLHVLAPLSYGATAPTRPCYGTLLHADVLALADPGAETDVAVGIALPDSGAGTRALQAIREWTPDVSQALLGVVPCTGTGLTPAARSRARAYALAPVLTCRMRLTDWSLEAAAWLATYLAECLGSADVGESALIEVLKEDDQRQRQRLAMASG
ncbi:hypothetical protein NGF19_01290 [Streptomyces sp. RY43-2]|uniref:Uncharacterized protein n=1 Tax=Streptomyces macrolidinus TaxID=2952607 RepID=A0ABT0Z7H1_9ACTN|nr:hypothetical protein [Streptomyces macrolidinus]MCN9239430.1 hypothetical protein [Streptomyces macrolidinus]